MSNQDRLLSDEELESKLTEVIALMPLETGAKLTEIGWEKYGENEQEAIKKLLDLINTQKRLYAESVIGEDEVVSGSYPLEDWKKERAAVINTRLAEQRARIKSCRK